MDDGEDDHDDGDDNDGKQDVIPTKADRVDQSTRCLYGLLVDELSAE